MKRLSNLKSGYRGIISDIDSHSEQNRYLLEMGFTPGEELEVLSVSPFGGPLSVRIRGTVIALRRKEAESIKC